MGHEPHNESAAVSFHGMSVAQLLLIVLTSGMTALGQSCSNVVKGELPEAQPAASYDGIATGTRTHLGSK